MIIFFGFNIWFWVLMIAEFIFLSWFVEEEWGIASFISIAAFFVLLWWLGDIPIWKWIHDNPEKLVKYIIYYIIIGMIWTVVKYYFKLKKLQTSVKNLKEAWKNYPDGSIYPTFRSYIEDRHPSSEVFFEKSTSRLTLWAIFWPTSMIWTVLNDPIKKLFNWLIYDIFIGTYKMMYDKMIGKIIDS